MEIGFALFGVAVILWINWNKISNKLFGDQTNIFRY